MKRGVKPEVGTAVAYAFGYTKQQRTYHESSIRTVTHTDKIEFFSLPTPDIVSYLSAHPEIIVVVTGLENGEVKHHMLYLHVLTNPIIVLGDTVLICYCLERMLERHRVSIMLAPQEDEFDLCYERICNGQIYVTRAVYDRKKTVCNGASDLTPKQNQILECLLQLMSEREIASLLNVSVGTIKVHKTRIFEKYGVAGLYDLWQLFGILKKNNAYL